MGEKQFIDSCQLDRRFLVGCTEGFDKIKPKHKFLNNSLKYLEINDVSIEDNQNTYKCCCFMPEASCITATLQVGKVIRLDNSL